MTISRSKFVLILHECQSNNPILPSYLPWWTPHISDSASTLRHLHIHPILNHMKALPTCDQLNSAKMRLPPSLPSPVASSQSTKTLNLLADQLPNELYCLESLKLNPKPLLRCSQERTAALAPGHFVRFCMEFSTDKSKNRYRIRRRSWPELPNYIPWQVQNLSFVISQKHLPEGQDAQRSKSNLNRAHLLLLFDNHC